MARHPSTARSTVGEAEDSSSLADQPELLRREIARSGYLVLRGLLPRAVVAAVRADLTGVLRRAGWLGDPPGPGGGEPAGSPPSDAASLPGPEAPATDAAARRIYRELFSRQLLHELAHHRVLVDLAGCLLEDEDVLVLPRPVCRVVLPGREGDPQPSPAHQDHLGMQGTTDALTMWMPLTACSREMGTLALAAGSNRDGVRDYLVRPGSRVLSCRDDDLADDWVTTDFAPGDVCVFSCLTVHKALVNESPVVRLSVDARYQRASDPVGALSVREDDDLRWEDVYRGWTAGAPRYRWRRPDLRVVPYDPLYHTDSVV